MECFHELVGLKLGNIFPSVAVTVLLILARSLWGGTGVLRRHLRLPRVRSDRTSSSPAQCTSGPS